MLTIEEISADDMGPASPCKVTYRPRDNIL